MPKKKPGHKKNKIRLILLEGPSDKLFFESFKKKYGENKLDVLLLPASNQNFNKINRQVDISRDLGYSQTWLVVDLKTQKPGTKRHYLDKNELLRDYEKHLDEFKSSHMVVMIQDLECWLLLYFNKYNNTETINNAEDKIKQYMEVRGKIGKPLVTQTLLKKPDFWDRLIKNKNKNKSFRDFLYRVDPNL
jgi:hypothetical protein